MTSLEKSSGKSREPGRLQRVGQRVVTWLADEDRPRLGAHHWYYLPVAMGIAATGVAVADEAFGTDLRNKLAGVCVEKDNNDFVRLFQEVVQEIGVEAGGQRCKPTDIPKHDYDPVSGETVAP